MFIRKTVKRHNGRSYTSYLLVESVRTPQGPRQKTICSLGDLSPGPRQKWLGLVGTEIHEALGRLKERYLDVLPPQLDRVRPGRPS